MIRQFLVRTCAKPHRYYVAGDTASFSECLDYVARFTDIAAARHTRMALDAEAETPAYQCAYEVVDAATLEVIADNDEVHHPMLGKTVSFWAYGKTGQLERRVGVVTGAFREPIEEDAQRRLNYHVRMPDGTAETPYADECRRDLTEADKAVRAEIETLWRLFNGMPGSAGLAATEHEWLWLEAVYAAGKAVR